MNRHLSPQQIEEWVVGERSPEMQAHVQSCAVCAEELARASEPLALFGTAVRNWGDQQRGPLRASWKSAQPPVWRWRIGLAMATLTLLLAAPVYQHRRTVQQAALAAARTQAEDEVLLRQVQQEISRSVPSPMEPLAKLMPNDLSR
jgi:hypothetical protein